jgi:hypothetical protein
VGGCGVSIVGVGGRFGWYSSGKSLIGWVVVGVVKTEVGEEFDGNWGLYVLLRSVGECVSTFSLFGSLGKDSNLGVGGVGGGEKDGFGLEFSEAGMEKSSSCLSTFIGGRGGLFDRGLVGGVGNEGSLGEDELLSMCF